MDEKSTDDLNTYTGNGRAAEGRRPAHRLSDADAKFALGERMLADHEAYMQSGLAWDEWGLYVALRKRTPAHAA